MRIREAFVPLLGLCGLSWAAISVLDPLRPQGRLFGPLLVLAALFFRLARRESARPCGFALALALAWSFAASVLVEFRADSAAYFAYLRSASFDRDLDFRNEMREIRGEDRPLPGRRVSVFSAGPAVVWSPFYLAAHAYVRLDRAFGRGLYEIDGFSLPYRRATALGTTAVVVLGCFLLFSALERRWGAPIAALAVLGSFLASPVLYYTFYVPAMSHGVGFGLAASFLWAWDRARRAPSLRSWTLLGGILGLLAACRWQASVYGVLLAILAVEAFVRGRMRLSWLVSSAAAAVLAFTPQLIAWQVFFGRALLLPQGRGFLDLSSRHWLETLISADHGFFNWTPLMLFGFLGLVAGIRKLPLLHGGGLLVLGIVGWVNGSVPSFDWAAGDAFGARRYSEVVPLMAVGLAYLLELSSRALRRWPLLAPAAAIAVLILWNFGFVSHFRARKYPDAAPLERLARDQARLLQDRSESALGAAAGAEGRALAYKIFSAEYFYAGLNPSGTILLRSADERTLLRGWHTGSRRTARRTYRRALYPEACVAVPLDAPFALRVSITARAPDGLFPQTLALAVNDSLVGSSPLGADWQEIPFLVPAESLVPGKNVFCLRFTRALSEPGEPAVAALVEKIQLP
jgi:hypothetical protein